VTWLGLLTRPWAGRSWSASSDHNDSITHLIELIEVLVCLVIGVAILLGAAAHG
jgi:hypothetical protein